MQNLAKLHSMLNSINTDYSSLLYEQHYLKIRKQKTPSDEQKIVMNERTLLSFEKNLSAATIIASTRSAFALIPAQR